VAPPTDSRPIVLLIGMLTILQPVRAALPYRFLLVIGDNRRSMEGPGQLPD
jgi:hypothetical protein